MPNLLSLSHAESGRKLKSFEFLRKFPNLRKVYLSGFLLEQGQPLPTGTNPKLEALRIDMWEGLTTQNLDAYMAGKPNLTEVGIRRPFLTSEQDVTFLGKYKQLKKLRLFDDVGPDVNWLGSLAKMEYLWLKLDTNTRNLGFLAKMPKLRHLHLSSWRGDVDDIGMLKNYATLEAVWLHGFAKLKDISALKSCKKLKYLSISRSQVTLDDLRGIQKILPDCYIEQLAPKKKKKSWK